MKATNIMWDVDSPEEKEFLPTEIDIPDGMTDSVDISDYLSDVTGFCHNGFTLEGNERGKSVKELPREQLIELKQTYYCEMHKSVSWGELAAVDELVSDEEIFAHYEGVCFTDDDFFCTAAFILHQKRRI